MALASTPRRLRGRFSSSTAATCGSSRGIVSAELSCWQLHILGLLLSCCWVAGEAAREEVGGVAPPGSSPRRSRTRPASPSPREPESSHGEICTPSHRYALMNSISWVHTEYTSASLPLGLSTQKYWHQIAVTSARDAGLWCHGTGLHAPRNGRSPRIASTQEHSSDITAFSTPTPA